ncbi:MAG: hypothetical protein RQ724_10115, partial [Desulfuromonadales bacterium]|nr:hypothetical protein [Desulfuromonadales bacterium]
LSKLNGTVLAGVFAFCQIERNLHAPFQHKPLITCTTTWSFSERCFSVSPEPIGNLFKITSKKGQPKTG